MATIPNPHSDLFALDLHPEAAQDFYIRSHTLRDALTVCQEPPARTCLSVMVRIRGEVVNGKMTLNLIQVEMIYSEIVKCGTQCSTGHFPDEVMEAANLWRDAANRWYGNGGVDDMEKW